MNKFNKLLSIFVIAGAVATGTAALVGCGGGEQPHTHSATKHEAVAATCTHAGTKEYYTCSGSECEGKYFSDEACTTEVTLESLTIAATGHSATKHEAVAATCTQAGNSAYYTCSGSECEGKYYSDEACTTEIASTVIPALGHKDDDNNILCDNGCGTKFFNVGNYYGLGTSEEIEVKEDGAVWYNDEEYQIEFSEADVATLTLNVLRSGSSTPEEVTYTVTKTAEGYKAVAADETIYFIKKPQDLGVERAGFKGVFVGEYTFNNGWDGTYKITKLAITADGMLQLTQVKIKDEKGNDVTCDPITQLIDGSSATIIDYNDFYVGGLHMIATKVEDGTYEGEPIKYVTELNISAYGETLATFTKTDEQVKAVPTSLPIAAGSFYRDAATGFRLAAVENTFNNTVSYRINGYSLNIVNGDDTTKEYLIIYYDYNAEEIHNYTLKINADNTAIDVCSAITGAKIATIALQSEVTFPALKVDGTVNNHGEEDSFNDYGYVYYSVENAGYYRFFAGEKEITIYTEVSNDDHSVTSWGESVLAIKPGRNKTVQLPANCLIAVYSSNNKIGFTATYSDTEPDPYYEAFVDGQYLMKEFDATDTYYAKVTASEAGTYVISVDPGAYYEDRGVYFEVNGTKYGYSYDSDTYTWSTYPALVCELTLEANDVVAVKIGCEYSYLEPGDTIAKFETKAAYEARIAAEAIAPTYSGDQLGVYKGEHDVYIKVNADGLQMSEDGITYADLTFVKTLNGKGVYAYEGECSTVSFTEEGHLMLSSGSDSLLLTKPHTFDSELVGKYKASYKHPYYGYSVTVKIIIGEDSVFIDEGNGAYEIIFFSLKDGVYTYFSSGYNGISKMSFSFDKDGNLVILSDDINNMPDNTVVEKMDPYALEVEDNSIKVTNVTEGNRYTFTAPAAGNYAFIFDTNGIVKLVGTDEATPITSGTVLTLTEGQTVTFVCLLSDTSATEGSFTLTIAEGVLALGENTINVTNYWEGDEYKFIAGEAGTYTITFGADGDVCKRDYYPGAYYPDEEWITSGYEVELAAGETLILGCFMASGATGDTYTLTITKK